MRTAAIAITCLIVGAAAGVGLTLAVSSPREVRLAVVSATVDADARSALAAADVAAHLAEAEHGDVPARLDALAADLAALEGETRTHAALRDYSASLQRFSAELRVAAEADAGWRGAAGRTWAAVVSLAGDEKRQPANQAAIVSRRAEVAAAAAEVAAAADAAGLDLAAACPTLPGVEALDGR